MAENRELQIILTLKDNVSGALKSAGSHIDQHAAQYRALGVALTATGAAMTAVGISALKGAARFEQSTVAFETMLGDAMLAQKTLNDLADFAARTPFELKNIETSAQRLLAYNIAAEDLIPTLRMLGDIAAGVGTDKMPQLILAFGQVKAATRLTGMELRQFTEAGVPLIGALSEHFGVAEKKIQEMVSAGEVGFEDVRTALAKMTQEGGKFFNLMDKQSKTYEGAVSNLKDSVDLFLREAGEPMLENAKEIVRGLGGFVDSARSAIKENKALAEAFGGVTIVGGGLVTLLGSTLVLAAGRTVMAINAIKVAFVTLAPWMAVITAAVAAATYASNKLTEGYREEKAAYDRMSEAYDEQYEKIIAARKATNEFKETVHEMSEEAIEAAKKLAELREEAIGIVKDIAKDEAGSKRQLAEELIAQEERVAELKKDISERSKDVSTENDFKALQEMQANLAKEEEALRNASFIRETLSDEVAEAERRASLTAFERRIEDIQAERKATMERHTERLNEITEEIKAEMGKNQQVSASYAQAQEEMREETRETTGVIQEEADKQKSALSAIASSIRSSLSGLGGFSIGGQSTPAFTPRASGGPVRSGGTYLVGERGPEIFRPNTGGTIIPNGGGPNVTVNVYGDVSGDDLVSKVSEKLMEALRFDTKFAL